VGVESIFVFEEFLRRQMNIIKKNQVAPKRKKREKKMTKWSRYKKYE